MAAWRRSAAVDDGYKAAARSVVAQLDEYAVLSVAFHDGVIDLGEGRESSEKLVAREQEVRVAAKRSHQALSQWTKTYAPGLSNMGRKDPTHGGFAPLAQCLEDCYLSVSLVHLFTLAGALYREEAEAAGVLTPEKVAALDRAPAWHNKVAEYAGVLMGPTPPPGMSEWITIYAESVRKPYKDLMLMQAELRSFVNTLEASGAAE